MSAKELYEKSVRWLTPVERLRLASLILEDLTASNAEGLDLRDDWSEEDVRDLASFSMKHEMNSQPLA
jgi:hypothetical protein